LIWERKIHGGGGRAWGQRFRGKGGSTLAKKEPGHAARSTPKETPVRSRRVVSSRGKKTCEDSGKFEGGWHERNGVENAEPAQFGVGPGGWGVFLVFGWCGGYGGRVGVVWGRWG